MHDGSDEVEVAFAAFGERKTVGGRKGEIGIRAYLDTDKNSNIYGNISHGLGITGKIEIDENGKEFVFTKSHNDSGSASRFFFSGKASKKDRDEGCEDMELRQTIGGGGGDETVKDQPGTN